MRIFDHPVLGILDDKEKVQITFNGERYQALRGESIAAALLANDVRILRYTERNHEPRGIYCGIGHCYECRVTVNGKRSVRACITLVEDNMVIQSQGIGQEVDRNEN